MRLAWTLAVAGALAAVSYGAAVAVGATRAAATQQLTLYSVAEQENFVNNADDRTRGVGNNPFGNFKDLQPSKQQNGTGPYPGDQAIFSFNLYSDAALTKRIGSASFTCQYNFAQNAYCDAAYHVLHRGTLVAGGTFDFDAPNFELVVTGGTGAYAGKSGALKETPGAKHSQKLAFTFAS